MGKSLRAGGVIDVPVKSWGIYLGVLGEKNKHIILAQKQLLDNTHNLYDIDYMTIPLN